MTEQTSLEEPLFINSGGQNIFAILHIPSVGNVDRACIFCHPFAEEKLWSHRTYVNIARILANMGILVVRFDMRGYGDSDGEFIDISLENQIEDTLTVINHINDRFTDIRQIGLIGLRLGATIAALVAAESNEINHLVLWDPVINGERYMQEILRSNLAAQMAETGQVELTRDDLIEMMKSGKPVNVEGYPLSFEYFASISEINLLEKEVPRPINTLIVQIVRNEKQPIHKDFMCLESIFPGAEITKAVELQFWREIKEFYNSANNLNAVTVEWLKSDAPI